MVRFVCVAPEHSRANGDPEASVLTIIAGEWALCPWGGAAGHVWDETEGVDIRAARSVARSAALRRREPTERREHAGAASRAT